jgi:hypothetical protein
MDLDVIKAIVSLPKQEPSQKAPDHICITPPKHKHISIPGTALCCDILIYILNPLLYILNKAKMSIKMTTFATP